MLIVMMDMDFKRYIHLCRLLCAHISFICFFPFTFQGLFNFSLCVSLSTSRTYQILLMIMPIIAMQNCVSIDETGSFTLVSRSSALCECVSECGCVHFTIELEIEIFHIHDTFELGMAQ